jgi:hypothetical protein
LYLNIIINKINMRTYNTIFIFLISLLAGNTFAQNAWKMLSAGTEFGLGIRNDGSLHSWGFNGNGQLGNGTTSAGLSAAVFKIESEGSWDYVSCGAVHAAGIKTDGSLWAWGGNTANQVNSSAVQSISVPTRIGTAQNWTVVDCGQAHTLALNTAGELYSWGFNVGGQLGNGNTSNTGIPVLVQSNLPWTDISAGGVHSLGIKSDSSLWAWGFNVSGQAGGTPGGNIVLPQKIGPDGIKWKSVSAGFEFSTAIDADGNLYTWGFNGNGQLGSGNTTQANNPILIDEGPWRVVAAGSAFSVGIKEDGSLFGWGANILGVLADAGSAQTILIPSSLSENTNWMSIAAAQGLSDGQSVYGFHFYAMADELSTFCASGANYAGQLNTGDLISSNGLDCSAGEITVAISEANFDINTIKMYPNPVHDYMQVELSNAIINDHWEICTLDGKKVLSGKLNFSTIGIDCSVLSSGMYIFKWTNGRQSNQKIFIKH